MLQLSVRICPEWTVKVGQNWPLDLWWSGAYSGIEKAALGSHEHSIGEAPMNSRMAFRAATIVGATMLVSLATLAGETMVKMGGDKIQQILPGNTIVGYDNGMRYSLWYPGGNDVIQTSEWGKKTGTWRIEKKSDQYCRTYDDGKGERCFEFFEISTDAQGVIFIEWHRGGRWSDSSVLVKGDQRENMQEIDSEYLR